MSDLWRRCAQLGPHRCDGIPADVPGELDQKLDDGNLYLGDFQLDTMGALDPMGVAAGQWNVLSAPSDCGAVTLIK